MSELASIRRTNMDALVAVSAVALRYEPADLTPAVRLRIEVETEMAYQAWANMGAADQAVFEDRPDVTELFRARAAIDREILGNGEGDRLQIVQSGEAGRRDH